MIWTRTWAAKAGHHAFLALGGKSRVLGCGSRVAALCLLRALGLGARRKEG